MITSQRKYYSQEFPTDGNHSLDLRHTPIDHSYIRFMHNPTGSNGVDCNKKQQLAKIGAPTFGDMTLAAGNKGHPILSL